MTDTAVRTKRWRIEWRGSTWTEEDITGEHFAVLVLLTGRDDISMLDLDPAIYDDSGEITDVHGLIVMSLIRMFRAHEIAQGQGEAESTDEATEALETAMALAMDEVGKASMANEILPSLSFID